MEAPKEIYVPLVDMGVEDGGIQPAAIWWRRDKSTETRNSKGAVKYVRADLVELTWEDIRLLFKIADNYESELVRPKYLSEEYCKEVLRRFLESKKEVEL